MRPRLVVHNVASVDGRLTLAPGLNLMAGDERWTAMTTDLPDPYAWARDVHDPQVFLEGSGSFLNPVSGPLLGVEPAPAPEGVHYLPDDVVGVPGRRWFAVVDGAGVVDLQFTEWPGRDCECDMPGLPMAQPGGDLPGRRRPPGPPGTRLETCTTCGRWRRPATSR